VGVTAGSDVDHGQVTESVSAAVAAAQSDAPAVDVPVATMAEPQIEVPIEGPIEPVVASAPAAEPAIETAHQGDASGANDPSGNGAESAATSGTAAASAPHHDPLVAAEAEGAAWSTLQDALADVTNVKPNGDTVAEPEASSQAAGSPAPVEIAPGASPAQ